MTVLREENGCFWGRAVVPEALGGPGTGPGTGTRGQAKMSEQGVTPALPRGRGDDPGSRRARRRRASQRPPPHRARGARNGDAAGAAPESHTGPRRRRERGRRTPRSTLRLPPAPAASPGRRPSPRPAVCPRPQERAAASGLRPRRLAPEPSSASPPTLLLVEGGTFRRDVCAPSPAPPRLCPAPTSRRRRGPGPACPSSPTPVTSGPPSLRWKRVPPAPP